MKEGEFYIRIRGRGEPKKSHPTYEEALVEAQRLAENVLLSQGEKLIHLDILEVKKSFVIKRVLEEKRKGDDDEKNQD